MMMAPPPTALSSTQQVGGDGGAASIPIKPTKPKDKDRFCFKSPVWARTIQRTIVLTVVFRQKDSEFVRLLEDIRWGHLTGARLRVFIYLFIYLLILFRVA
jgi:hypothetical protein